MPNSVSDALFIYCGGVGRTRGGGWGGVQIGIFVVFQWTHSFTPPFPSCCPHCHHCRRRIYSNIFEYLHRRIYSYSYSVDIFKPNIFVFVFGFYFWVEYIRIRIRFLFLNRIYSYSYSVFIFEPNIFVFVFGFYFWTEYIRIRIRSSKYYSLTSALSWKCWSDYDG